MPTSIQVRLWLIHHKKKNVALTFWEDFGLESLPKKEVFQIIECLQRVLRKTFFTVMLALQAEQFEGKERIQNKTRWKNVKSRLVYSAPIRIQWESRWRGLSQGNLPGWWATPLIPAVYWTSASQQRRVLTEDWTAPGRFLYSLLESEDRDRAFFFVLQRAYISKKQHFLDTGLTSTVMF